LPREVKILSAGPLKIPLGGTTQVSIGLPIMRKAENRFAFELSSPPDGISVQKIVSSDGRADIVVRSDAAKMKTGLEGNLIFIAVANRPANTKNAKNKNNNARFTLGALPAIPFRIVNQENP
jgi:hypothetical protein